MEYLHPSRFEAYKAIAEEIGFMYVASGPFVRSSYNAIDFSDKFLRGNGRGEGAGIVPTVLPAIPGPRRLELPVAVG